MTFLIAVAFYVILQLAISAWAARGTASDADYLVAGRRLGTAAVALSLFATWFAAEGVIATSAEVAKDGLAGARIDPLGYGLGILVLGLFVAAALRRAGHMTLAAYVGDRYGTAAEGLAALVIALSGGIWAAAQLYALATLVADASPLGFHAALATATAIVLVYTLVGGLIGDVVTDIVQGGVLVTGVVILFIMMISAAGGPGAALAVASEEPARFALSLPGESLLARAEIWIVPIVGSVVSQEAVVRALAARTPEIARRGAVIGSVIYIAFGLIPVAFGLVGPGLGLGVDASAGDAFAPGLAAALLSPFLLVVFSGALISAILSSVDSALLAVSAVATESGYRRLRPDASPRMRLIAARTITVGAGLAAFAVAASGDSLRDIVVAASSVAAAIAAPVFVAVIGDMRRGATAPAAPHPGAGAAAVAAIAVNLVLLGVLEWRLGVEGGYIIALAGGFAAFGAARLVARLARRMITLDRVTTGSGAQNKTSSAPE
ncbi:MAG: sodium:solute symporter [Pseudomonadota bacterium]